MICEEEAFNGDNKYSTSEWAILEAPGVEKISANVTIVISEMWSEEERARTSSDSTDLESGCSKCSVPLTVVFSPC